MPFGLARRFTRPVADLPQSAFAIAINFQSGPWRHLQWVDAYRQPQTLVAFAPTVPWQLAEH